MHVRNVFRFKQAILKCYTKELSRIQTFSKQARILILRVIAGKSKKKTVFALLDDFVRTQNDR